MTTWLAVLLIGAATGFLGGLFGKGGAAVASPLLAAAGVPAIVAVAAPLPATIPATALAAWIYHRQGLTDRRVIGWSILVGVPSAVAGALATNWVGGDVLLLITELVVTGLGLRFLFGRGSHERNYGEPSHPRLRIIAVATATGLAAGLLANSGGFLLAPLYVAVLRLPIKVAFACSLAVSAVLAIPSTIVHASLGHIDWAVVAVFGAASIPLSPVGARVAMRVQALHLERIYGGVLTVIGTSLLLTR